MMRPVLARLAMAALPVLAAGGSAAQVIPIKTVPVATGDQFLVSPSDRLGMGSVTIALQDTLGDPFANPAALTRLEGPRLFAAPTGYSITGRNGGALTLPVGAFLGTGRWRGGFALALQELDRPADRWTAMPLVDVAPAWPTELDQRSRTNLYAFGAVARTLGESGRTSIGASVSLADLSALGAVDLLYSRRTVDQRGSLLDLRLALETGWADGRVLEAVLVHSRLDMEHELVDMIWAPVRQPEVPPEQWPWAPTAVSRTERDETDTWGLHLAHTRPLPDSDGWILGGLLTINYKSHPKIPNYTLMAIPRDPGDSWAYDVGVGLAKRTGTATFAVDLVYEPVWTETWADAAAPVVAIGGDTIPAGDMTVLNDFRFNNAILRMGLAAGLEPLDLQLGLRLKRYGYTLDQTDFVLERRRRQQESWLEWSPSLSLAVDLGSFALRYSGRITTGTGRPGVRAAPIAFADAAALQADFIPAPSGALTLDEAAVHTHQLTVSIPLAGPPAGELP